MNTLRLAGWLRAGGSDVSILAPAGTMLHREAERSGCPVETVGRHSKYLDLPSAWRLRSLLGRRGIDVLFAVHRDDLDLLSWMKTLAGRALLLVYQQHMALGVPRRDPAHTFRYSRFDAWIAPLQWLRDEVLAKTRVPPEKIHVIPLGIDPARFGGPGPRRDAARRFFGMDDGGTVFGVLGRIDPGKGQLFVARAVGRLRERGHDARLLVVGAETVEPGRAGAPPGEATGRLRSELSSLGLESVSRIHPFVEDARMFYAAADIVVSAAPAETYGMVTLEAMASGTPVIGTDAAGTRELLGGGRFGMLFRPGDEAEFVRCAEAAIAGRYTGEMLFAARRRAREEFSSGRECSMILELVDRLRRERVSAR